MSEAAPGKGRSVIVDTPAGMKITIPPPERNRFAILFVGLWLVFWASISGAMVIPLLLASEPGDDTAFTLHWLGVWLFAGGFILYGWVWSVMGREVITVTGDGLRHAIVIPGHSRTKKYDLVDIENLRANPQPATLYAQHHAMELWGFRRGAVSFDYRGATHRFGSGIDEPEAKFLISEIRKRSRNL